MRSATGKEAKVDLRADDSVGAARNGSGDISISAIAAARTRALTTRHPIKPSVDVPAAHRLAASSRQTFHLSKRKNCPTTGVTSRSTNVRSFHVLCYVETNEDLVTMSVACIGSRGRRFEFSRSDT